MKAAASSYAPRPTQVIERERKHRDRKGERMRSLMINTNTNRRPDHA